MRFIVTFIACMAFSVSALANNSLSLKLDLETKIQGKITSLVQPLDPNAQVLVNINMKKISTDLPGTGAKVENFLSSSEVTQLSSSDIESIDVKVISKFEQVPDSLQQLVSQAANLPQVKMNLKFEKVDAQVADAINHRAPASEKAMSEVPAMKMTPFYVMGVLFIIALIASSFLMQNSFRREIGQVVTAINAVGSELSSGSANKAAMPTPALETATRAALSEPSKQSDDADRQLIQSLKIESLVALMSDCYWCENDQYAMWLWTQMSSMQRTQILSSWSYAETYIGTLNGEALYQTYHHHPYYLKPLRSEDISQEDMAQWLKKNPSAWHLISPMRQSTSKISLLERLSFSSTATPTKHPELPKATPKVRQLTMALNFSDISESDELEIMKNPNVVPEHVREQVQSLVWLALLPQQSRVEVLSVVSAQQLAQAWVGPKQVLSAIEADVGERKLKLLNDYKAKVTPQRKSVSMQYLVQESLKKWRDSQKVHKSAA